MRLIDADNLTKRIRKANVKGWNFMAMTLIEKQIETESSFDAVPVIRCKDCKFYEEEDPYNACGRLCVYFARPNDFCSKAERREGDESD